MKAIMILPMLLLIAPITNALTITEVMYDPDGSDYGREWIEVHNTDEPVDIKDFYLREDDVNHGMSLYQGQTLISKDESFIIASDPTRFMEDYPTYQNTLMDSSFSLKNSEPEHLFLLDDERAELDHAYYQVFDKASQISPYLDNEVRDNWQPSDGNPGYLPASEVPEFSTAGILISLLFSSIIISRHF